MKNQYGAICHYCGRGVHPGCGTMWKFRSRYYVAHPACAKAKTRDSRPDEPSSIVIGGKEYTRNAKGRCEDAPCCGCCTI